MESFFRFRLLISPAEQNTRVAEQTLKVKNLNSGGEGTLLCKRKASSPSISHSLFCLWNWSCCLAKCSHSALQRVYTRKSYNKLMDLVTPQSPREKSSIGGDRGMGPRIRPWRGYLTTVHKDVYFGTSLYSPVNRLPPPNSGEDQFRLRWGYAGMKEWAV